MLIDRVEGMTYIMVAREGGGGLLLAMVVMIMLLRIKQVSSLGSILVRL